MLTGGNENGLEANEKVDGVTVEGNRARGNLDDGFQVGGSNHTIRDNDATGNGWGFFTHFLNKNSTFTRNVAGGNSADGFFLGGRDNMEP